MKRWFYWSKNHIKQAKMTYLKVCVILLPYIQIGGASNEYPQHMFLSRDKKKRNQYFSVEKKPNLICRYVSDDNKLKLWIWNCTDFRIEKKNW